MDDGPLTLTAIRPGAIVAEKYLVGASVGSGDSTALYETVDRATGQPRTLQVMMPRSGEPLLARLKAPIAALARITHLNVARIVDSGELPSGAVYVVMEHIEGETLEAILRRKGRLSVEDTIDYATQLCLAIVALHRGGFVHGHLDTSAVFVVDDVRGPIVKLLAVGTRGTVARDAYGFTPRYQAPEDLVRGAADARGDIWALGVVMYEMLTGTYPFQADSATHVAVAIQTRPVPRLETVRADVPQWLADIVARCLEKRPESRPKSAKELASTFIRANLSNLDLVYARPAEKAAVRDMFGLRRGGQAPRVRPPTDEIQFSVYQPRKIRPRSWHTLLAFAHLAERRPDAPPEEPDPVEEVDRRAARSLALEVYTKLVQNAAVPVAQGDEISFRPQIAGVEFNPEVRTFRWTESVHEEGFRFRASSEEIGQVLRGRMLVFQGLVLLASIELRMQVEEGVETGAPAVTRANVFKQVFASYSHKDAGIVAQLANHVNAVGARYLIDVFELRAGQIWNDRILRLIETADAFQLFWSNNARQSEFVRREWECALATGRRDFIWPVYWEEPMPPPPSELKQLHFHCLKRASDPSDADGADWFKVSGIGSIHGTTMSGAPVSENDQVYAGPDAGGRDVSFGPPREAYAPSSRSRWPAILFGIALALAFLVGIAWLVSRLAR